MRIKRILARTLALLMVAVVLGIALYGCSGEKEDGRSVVFEDMKAAFDRSGLLSANIGIFSRTEKDGSITYGECGSGVVKMAAPVTR